ncbi:hypothetical protein QBC38DRAFT_27285 [Podospora fimiseda]|uniref:Xylanolytic transcriptional activator regulatory domain-containing protein n=1 Tax=Podospora fimiseda TaxID=252190 RepID=A0AAN7GTB9_9PEZI|nr:hypothetical protein QBC38DRAFT_27285 [Podospora fimiseda]
MANSNNGAGPSQPVRFVDHDESGLPVKRRQVARACEECRKKKKRCRHFSNGDDADSNAPDVQPGPEPKRQRSHAPSRSSTKPLDWDVSDAAVQLLRFFSQVHDKPTLSSPDGAQTSLETPQPERAPQFLGETNPQGILAEATMTADGDKRIGVSIPVWAASDSRENSPPAENTPSGSVHNQEERDGPPVTQNVRFAVSNGDGKWVSVQDLTTSTLISQILSSVEFTAAILPSDSEWSRLRDIYLQKLQPIFPAFEESTLLDLPKETLVRELIQASVCLAVSTDPDAQGYLNLGDPQHRRAVDHKEYSRVMANLINTRIRSPDLPVLYSLQILAVTCLYWQPDNIQERSGPSTLFSRLVSVVHIHGIHLAGHKTGPGPSDNNGRQIFKCLYALDRLLSAFSGRPVMFHNDDIERPTWDNDDRPSFRLFMSLILLLDEVIEMYRPRPKLCYIDIPVYESMALDVGAQDEPEGILTTLEVFYHAIGVLSVRMGRDRFVAAPEQPGSSDQSYRHLPPSHVNARRSHSSDRILDVTSEYKLSPMPFIPYALSLSLSVAYRKWRFSKLPVFKTRGKADFQKVLAVLRDYSKTWGNAYLSVKLGDAVVKNLERGEAFLRWRYANKNSSEAPEGMTAATPGVPITPTSVPSPLTCLLNGPIYPAGPSSMSTLDHMQSFSGMVPDAFPALSSFTLSEDVSANDSLIFDSWDKNFTQMIDNSFASYLDPGNPFGSGQYLGLM